LSSYAEEDMATTFLKDTCQVFLELLTHESIDNGVHTAVSEGNGFSDVSSIDQPLVHGAAI
jgi:hypothetical protein